MASSTSTFRVIKRLTALEPLDVAWIFGNAQVNTMKSKMSNNRNGGVERGDVLNFAPKKLAASLTRVMLISRIVLQIQ